MRLPCALCVIRQNYRLTGRGACIAFKARFFSQRGFSTSSLRNGNIADASRRRASSHSGPLVGIGFRFQTTPRRMRRMPPTVLLACALHLEGGGKPSWLYLFWASDESRPSMKGSSTVVTIRTCQKPSPSVSPHRTATMRNSRNGSTHAIPATKVWLVLVRHKQRTMSHAYPFAGQSQRRAQF